ncbi:unnamed protein product, partial [Prorocentrum cordatum]
SDPALPFWYPRFRHNADSQFTAMAGMTVLLTVLAVQQATAGRLRSVDRAVQNGTHALAGGWTPEPCGELPEGVPCRNLYEHPAGSTYVGPCPVESYAHSDGCAAQFEGKSDADKCPQLSCPKAL